MMLTSDEKYLSVDGKIWVNYSQIPFSVEKFLEDNEEIYIESGRLEKYVYKSGEREVIINHPKIGFEAETEEAFKIMRNIAKSLLECYPNAKKIVIYDEFFGSSTPMLLIDGKRYIGENVLLEDDVPEYAKRISVFDVCKLDVYIDKYRELVDTPQSYEVFERYPYVIGKYFITWGKFGPVIHDVERLLETGEFLKSGYEIRFDPVMPVYSIDREKLCVFRDSNSSIVLKSPKRTPDNAFLIGDEPLYLQFTKKGIILTNGVIFADEELDEVTLPWYVVRKTDYGWIIFVKDVVSESMVLDGVYVIDGGSLKKIYPDQNNEKVEGRIIYKSADTLVAEVDGKIVVNGKVYDKKDFFTRVKINATRQGLYVPLILLKKILPRL